MGFSALSSQSKIGLIILALLIVAVIISLVWISNLLIQLIRTARINDAKEEDYPLFADVSYFYEKGNRERQEDSLYISHLDDYVDYGILACVSDGMGGLKYGSEISKYVIDEVEKLFPINFYDSEVVADCIKKISGRVFEKYARKGGATLVMVHVFKDRLNFYSVGDSNIILIRNNIATCLNPKQNYSRILIKNLTLEGKTTEEAYLNKKGRALVDFMGNNNIRVNYSQSPLKLFDGDIIVICSDGVTDAISLNSMINLIGNSARKTAENIKLAIRMKNFQRQDNYSAVVIKLNKYNF
ncbi:MAG: SpoIIE family protein phosphatase [Clostridia bacterium]|nr:SpoIIE family protein phosphatase [Clostridia bacterium]